MISIKYEIFYIVSNKQTEKILTDRDLKTIFFKKNLIFDESESSSFSLAVNDFDNNGFQDIAVGNSPGPTKLYLNISNGQKWLENILSNNQFRTYDILDSDINNDGKIDIMEANTDENNFYFINK